MGKASSASDVDGSMAYNAVFIDTSLDTHLAMVVSDVDTVSDLKKKIMYEHPLCFPDIGEIKIHALKVKRKGYFYHLSDSMLVKCAFDGVKKNWFLGVDASYLAKHSENRLSCNPDSGNRVCIINNPSVDGVDLLPDDSSKRLSIVDYSLLRQVGSSQDIDQNVPDADQNGPGDSVREVSKDLEIEVKHISDDQRKPSSSESDTNKRSGPEIQEKYDLISKQNEMLGSERKEDSSQNGAGDMQCADYLEGTSKIGPVRRKMHKIKKKNKDVGDECVLQDNRASIDLSSKNALQQEIIVLQNHSGNAGEEASHDMKMGTRHMSDEPGETLSSGVSKRLDSALQKKYELCDGTEVPVTHVECKNDMSNDKVVDVLCNDLLGEASQSRPSTKKRRKIKKKNGVEDSLEEKEALICNSTKETSRPEYMIPENSLEDKQNKTDAINDGLSIEPPQDVHLMRNSSSSGSRKRKRKSSGSVEDVREEGSKETVGFNHKYSGKEFDAAIIPGQSFHGAKNSESCAISLKEKHSDPVQEVGEGNKVPCSSLDVDMSDAYTGNVERKGEASDIVAASGISRKKSSKKHHAVDAKGHPPLVAKEPHNLDKDIRLSGHDNIVSNDHHKFGTDQAHKIGQGIELPQNSNPPDTMLSEKCKPSSRDETGMNDKELVLSSELVDVIGFVEPGRSAGKRRKSKKDKNSVGGTQVTSGGEQAKGYVSVISSSDPHKAFNSDHSNNEAKKEESILSQTEENKVSKIKTVSTHLLGADREADEMSGNEVESLQQTQINKSQENSVNMDEKVKKKTRKKQGSAARNFPDLQRKDQLVDPKDFTPSTDNIKEVDSSSIITRKTELVETNSKDLLNGSNLEPGKGIEIGSFHPQHVSGAADTCQAQGRPLQDNVDGNPLISGRTDKANKDIEVSNCGSDRINFNDYFVPSQCQQEVVASAEALNGKVTKAKRSDSEMKAKENSTKSGVHVNHGNETKFRGGNSSTIQGSLSKDGSMKLLPHSNRKSSKVSEDRVEAGPSSNIDKFDSIPEVGRRPNVVKASGISSPARAYSKENIEAFVASSSTLGSSEDRIPKHQSGLDQYRVMARKGSGKNIGKVVNSYNYEKSLLAMSGNIFKDGNSESSEDDGLEDSDATTRTPSDDSSSSDFSEVENKANPDTPATGSHGTKRKDVGGRNILESHSLGPKNVTLDTILRSSSRFKKAKLTASQSQLEDTESPPVDFVPDSQANL